MIDYNFRDALQELPNIIMWANILGNNAIVISNWRNSACNGRNHVVIKCLFYGILGSYRGLSFDESIHFQQGHITPKMEENCSWDAKILLFMHKTHKKVYTQVDIQYIQGNTISWRTIRKKTYLKDLFMGAIIKKNTFD